MSVVDDLRARLERASQGTPQFVLMGPDTAPDLEDFLRGVTGRVLRARCAPEDADPYAPLLQLAPKTRRELVPLLARLERFEPIDHVNMADLIATAGDPSGLPPRLAPLPRERLTPERSLAFRCFLEALGQGETCVVAIEDLQNADEETRLVLGIAAATLRDARLMVAGTSRGWKPFDQLSPVPDGPEEPERPGVHWPTAASAALGRAAPDHAYQCARRGGNSDDDCRLQMEALIRRVEIYADQGHHEMIPPLLRLAHVIRRDEDQLQKIELAAAKTAEYRRPDARALAAELCERVHQRQGTLRPATAARIKWLEALAQADDLEALKTLQEGIELLQKTKPETPETLRALADLFTFAGHLQMQRGELSMASDIHNAAFSASRAAGDRWREARSLLENAAVSSCEKATDSALREARDALGRFRDMGDHAGMAEALLTIGVALHLEGRVEDAVEHFRRDARLCQDLNHRRVGRQAFIALTNALTRAHRRKEALDAYAQWLTIHREGEEHETATILVQMALLNMALGDYGVAEEQNNFALGMFRKLGDTHWTVGCLNNALTIHADRGEYERAERAHQEVLQLADEDRGLWETCWRVAAVHADRGEFERAQAAIDKAKNAAPAGFAQQVVNLAGNEIRVETGEPPFAMEEIERREFKVWNDATWALHVAQSGRGAEALRVLDATRTIAESPECGFRYRLRFLRAEATALIAIGRFDEGRKVARQLCELAREKGFRPMLARGLLLAGRGDEAHALAVELGMKLA